MKRILILAFAVLGLSATSAAAQCVGSCSGSKTISIVVPAMLKITVNGAFGFPAPSVSDVDNQATLSGPGVSIDTKANVAYHVTAATTLDKFSLAPVDVADIGYVKATSDVHLTVGATTLNMSSAAATLFSHARGTATDAVGATLKINLADVPGTYTTDVTFTIVAG